LSDAVACGQTGLVDALEPVRELNESL
jgi:hypothetical protein